MTRSVIIIAFIGLANIILAVVQNSVFDDIDAAIWNTLLGIFWILTAFFLAYIQEDK